MLRTKIHKSIVKNLPIFRDVWQKILLITIYSSLLVFSGCASSPDDLVGYYQSPYKHRNINCNQLTEKAKILNKKVDAYYELSEKNSYKDVAIVTTGVILFWPALFFVNGNNKDSSKYLIYKSEYDSLKKALTNKNCNTIFKN